MADPLRERIAADAALGALRALTDYERLFPGREPEVGALWRAAGGGRSTGGSGPPIEDATRGEIDVEALRVTGARRLELGEAIGAGGMGEVLAARDAVLRRPLALKRVLGAAASAGSVPPRRRPDDVELASRWRAAVARALVEHGLLHFKSRRVSPPISAFLAQVFS